MKQRLAHLMVVLAIMFGSVGLTAITYTPMAHASSDCNSYFFGLPAWYNGLTDGDCNIKQPADNENGLSFWIWRIVLNVIDAFLRVVAYIAVAFIIVGGYQYMIATGSPDKIKAAKDTIRNAIIGLVIAMSSVGIVNAIALNL